MLSLTMNVQCHKNYLQQIKGLHKAGKQFNEKPFRDFKVVAKSTTTTNTTKEDACRIQVTKAYVATFTTSLAILKCPDIQAISTTLMPVLLSLLAMNLLAYIHGKLLHLF